MQGEREAVVFFTLKTVEQTTSTTPWCIRYRLAVHHGRPGFQAAPGRRASQGGRATSTRRGSVDEMVPTGGAGVPSPSDRHNP